MRKECGAFGLLEARLNPIRDSGVRVEVAYEKKDRALWARSFVFESGVRLRDSAFEARDALFESRVRAEEVHDARLLRRDLE